MELPNTGAGAGSLTELKSESTGMGGGRFRGGYVGLRVDEMQNKANAQPARTSYPPELSLGQIMVWYGVVGWVGNIPEIYSI